MRLHVKLFALTVVETLAVDSPQKGPTDDAGFDVFFHVSKL